MFWNLIFSFIFQNSRISGVGGRPPPASYWALMYYHCIVAVGLLGAKVMLVNLNMDDAAESSENSPGRLVYLDLTEVNHIVIELNMGGGSVSDKFAWHGVLFNNERAQVSLCDDTHQELC